MARIPLLALGGGANTQGGVVVSMRFQQMLLPLFGCIFPFCSIAAVYIVCFILV